MKTRKPARPYRDIQIDGKTYEIDMTSERIDVTLVEERKDTTGIFIRALAEATGKTPIKRHYFEVDDETRVHVILSAGWKFSTSQRWRKAWDYLWRQSGRDSSYE